MKAPFPWFGGKSAVADEVFSRLGRIDRYIEPFAGSLALLLANPRVPNVEIVNDADAYLANFWRAAKLAPDDVAMWADDQVSELDLHARHQWLSEQTEFRERMRADPDYFDAKMAGWWLWGISAWIGGGWCAGEGLPRRRPRLGRRGSGIHSAGRRGNIIEILRALRYRLRHVCVCCGDWKRVVGSPTVLDRQSVVILDPPYQDSEHGVKYSGGMNVWDEVVSWCEEHSDTPHKIALFGYEGTWDAPHGWVRHAWKTDGGMGKLGQGRGIANAARETIWFSPACDARRQLELAI